VYRNAVDRTHLSQVNVLLNEIPGRGEVDILLSPIHSLTSRKVELVDPRLEVGGESVTFPVTLQSGQYIELESLDNCVLYDERGALVCRCRPQVATFPSLARGSNWLRFDCAAPKHASARAEVTVVSLGTPFGTRRDESEVDWKCLDREYDIPRLVTQGDGTDNVWSITRRADAPNGQRAVPPVLEIEMEVERLGDVKKEKLTVDAAPYLDTPVFTIGDASVQFPVQLQAGQRLVCREHAGWRVLSADGGVSASGSVSVPFPTLAPGANRVSLAFKDAFCGDFRVMVKTVKVYRDPKKVSDTFMVD
jgi:hypothetical protein